jgi:hypothetical protein
MNEEIAKILQMLEAGTISADEAERLIRAVREEPGSSRAGGRPASDAPVEPFHSLKLLFRRLSEAQMRAARRQLRWMWHCRYRAASREARDRAHRIANMATAEQVRWLLLERVQVDDRDPRPESRLTDLLAPDPCDWDRSTRVPWDTLRLALEAEFGIAVDRNELQGLVTVQDLADYVEARVPPRASAQAAASPEAAEQTGEPPNPTTPDPQEPPAPPAERPSRRRTAEA